MLRGTAREAAPDIPTHQTFKRATLPSQRATQYQRHTLHFAQKGDMTNLPGIDLCFFYFLELGIKKSDPKERLIWKNKTRNTPSVSVSKTNQAPTIYMTSNVVITQV